MHAVQGSDVTLLPAEDQRNVQKMPVNGLILLSALGWGDGRVLFVILWLEKVRSSKMAVRKFRFGPTLLSFVILVISGRHHISKDAA